MAICIEVDPGTGSFIPSASSIGSCTDYVLYTASDYAALNPQLTVSDSIELAWLVVFVWTIAWCIRVLKKVFF